MLQRNDTGYGLIIPFEDEARGIVHKAVAAGETIEHSLRVHALTLVDEAGEKLAELSDEALREANGIVREAVRELLAEGAIAPSSKGHGLTDATGAVDEQTAPAGADDAAADPSVSTDPPAAEAADTTPDAPEGN